MQVYNNSYLPSPPGVLPSKMKDDTILSQSSFCESSNTKTKSNLLSKGLARATLTLMDCWGSYCPLGFVAARMVALVFSLHTRPAYKLKGWNWLNNDLLKATFLVAFLTDISKSKLSNDFANPSSVLIYIAVQIYIIHFWTTPLSMTVCLNHRKISKFK